MARTTSRAPARSAPRPLVTAPAPFTAIQLAIYRNVGLVFNQGVHDLECPFARCGVDGGMLESLINVVHDHGAILNVVPSSRALEFVIHVGFMP